MRSHIIDYTKVAKLVTFILETELWKTSFLWEHEYNIHLFISHTKEDPYQVLHYLKFALNKLLGEVYTNEQSRLKKLLNIYPGQTKQPPHPFKQRNPGEHTNYKRKPAKPRSVFGRKYLEHYGYGSTENLNQYYFEYKYYQENKRCRWEENEKEG